MRLPRSEGRLANASQLSPGKLDTSGLVGLLFGSIPQEPQSGRKHGSSGSSRLLEFWLEFAAAPAQSARECVSAAGSPVISTIMIVVKSVTCAAGEGRFETSVQNLGKLSPGELQRKRNFIGN